MKSTVSLATLAAAAFSCAFCLAGPAAAQQASITRFGSYVETQASRTCSGTVNCTLFFTVMPKTYDVLLDTVTCGLNSSHIPASLTLRAPAKGGSGPARKVNLPIRDYTYVKRIATTDYVYALSFTIPTKLYVEAETQPVISFYTSATEGPHSQDMTCMLAGKVLK